ncbi:MAG: SPW repeat protein [Halobacteriaceae archaeon]
MSLYEDLRKNWESAIVAVVGAWIVAAPFIFDKTGIGVTLSGVMIGLIIMSYGAYDVKQKQIWGNRIARYWAMTGLGLWVAVSPWFFHTPNPLRTSNLVSGLIVAVLGGYQWYDNRETSVDPTELGSDFRNN